MRNRYWLIYLLLVVAQILLGNFLNLGQLVTICLLPMLVLSLPVKYPGALVMGIAFGTSAAKTPPPHIATARIANVSCFMPFIPFA